MSVGRVSGGFACMNAANRLSVPYPRQGRHQRTFCSHIFHPLQVVHVLQRVGLLPGQGLLIIILTRSAYPIEEDLASTSVSEKVEDGEDQDNEGGRSKGGEHADEDSLAGGPIVATDVYDNVGAVMRRFSPGGARVCG